MYRNVVESIKNSILVADISWNDDPWDKLNNTDLTTTLGDYSEYRDTTNYAVFNLTDIYAILINIIRVGGVVMIAGSLIAIIIMGRNDKMVAEHKSKIMFRLTILLLAGFAITIFNVLYSVAEGSF